MSKKAIRILATVVILGGAFITVLATSMRENTQYYKHVDEVMPQAAAWYDKGLQLHGFVVDGSIMKRPNTLDYQFKVKNGESEVLARYTGVVPDTFKDGAEVVLKGRLSAAGFAVEPNGVMAKCPSKYEAGAQASTNVPMTGVAR
jgi:cytochrome c-type biogenesis protein CcmE